MVALSVVSSGDVVGAGAQDRGDVGGVKEVAASRASSRDQIKPRRKRPRQPGAGHPKGGAGPPKNVAPPKHGAPPIRPPKDGRDHLPPPGAIGSERLQPPKPIGAPGLHEA